MENDDASVCHLPVSRTDDQLPEPANLARIFNGVGTQRLLLRRLRIGDGPAMFAVHGDPATNHYNPAGPDPDLATSEETLRDWMLHWETDGLGSHAPTDQAHPRLWRSEPSGLA